MSAPNSNSASAAAYLTHQRERDIPAPSLNAAKMALVDWVCVCLGARETPEAHILSKYHRQTGDAPGTAPLLIGDNASATRAALINGALSHCLDYDDTHIPTALHGGGPTWAAVFALGGEASANETDLLKAFVCGFEIGAALGDKGFGVRLNESGWHSTAVLGRIAAASAASYLLRLTAETTESALGLAATQAGGLTASFGTMAKPFHAGKAAMDGVASAQLARAGLQASTALFDSPKGLFATIFQDRSAIPSLSDLYARSELLLNSLKPYAACQLAHAPIDAARQLREQVEPAAIRSIKLTLNPLAIEIAGVENARTPTEGRFSTAYCVALAMHGYRVSPADFTPERLSNPDLVALAARVSMQDDPTVSRTSARLAATLTNGAVVTTSVEHAFGSAGNPMDWAQLERKFHSMVEPIFRERSAHLFETLATFERPGSYARFLAFIDDLEPIA